MELEVPCKLQKMVGFVSPTNPWGVSYVNMIIKRGVKWRYQPFKETPKYTHMIHEDDVILQYGSSYTLFAK